MALDGVPIAEVRGLGKCFESVSALDGVDLAVRPGEVHALVGENGAGKSTLIRILSGVLAPDAGEVLVDGQPVALGGPRDAARLGIAVSHQDPELFPSRTAAENCFLERRLPGGFFISWRAARREAQAALARLGADFAPASLVESLSASRRQIVSLAGALLATPRLLILDEPTAALSGAEAARLFAVVRELRAEGRSILYVSHRLAEVLALADRVTVLRDGRAVLTAEANRLTLEALVEAMVGRRIETYYPRPPEPEDAEPLLAIAGLTDPGGAFADVSFAVRPGEVLALYGLAGAGRSELGEALAGLRRARGSIRARGRVAYLPADRLRDGILPGLSLRENLALSSLGAGLSGLLVPRRRERELVASLGERLAIRAPGSEAPIETLSGGNQQKALLGRGLALEPAVLVLDEPTQGIDVGARAEVHALLAGLARSGRAVVLISSDLPEAIGLSHRVAAVREGRMAATFRSAAASEEEVGRAAFPLAGEGRSPAALEALASRQRRELAARELALVLAAVLIAAASGLRSPGFLSLTTARDVAAAAAPLALAALGETLIIASGAIDISIGPMLALAATAAARWAGGGGSIPGALALAALLGAGLGLLNAALSIAGRLHPVVTTLGMLGIYQGAFLLWTGGEWIDLPEGLLGLAARGPLGVPFSVWVTAAAAALIFIFLRWTRAGRACLNAGDNPRAARTHGLPVARTRLLAFAVLGALVGLAGVFHTARYGKVQNNTGSGFELLAIAAAVLGGARVAGGRGTVAGALLGAGLVALIHDARAVWGIHERWQLVAVGALMLAALVLEAAIAGARRRKPA